MIDRSSLMPMSGATFAEVLVAMALTSVGLIGTMGAFQAVNQQIGQDILATRAIELTESRLEAKRSMPWQQLLMDDLDHDGLMESFMHDDGTEGDRVAGDGIYTTFSEDDGVALLWTVAPNHGGILASSGYAAIEARASYHSRYGRHEVRMATLRANTVLAGPY